MSKHTPGPWRLVNTNDGPTIAGAEPGYLATTRGRFALKPPAEEAANARLIAASPELLGILEEAICAWPQFDDPNESVSGADLVEWFEFWRRDAKDAVARAR